MSTAEDKGRKSRRVEFQKEISAAEQRRIRGNRSEGELWFGLGMMGLVGWSVAIPTVVGVALGIWLDTRFAGSISWTLTGIFIGVGVGSASAWYWVSHEQQEANRDDEL